ncbi:MAG: hypothetical protein HUU29_02710 [Planctomycetaceae bacterium]|nr:hypothetical protein [Planctomycetaceae bacterium]
MRKLSLLKCLLTALVPLVASSAFAQHVAERYQFGFVAPTREKRGGSWEYHRVDAEGGILGIDQLLASGPVKSLSHFGIEYSSDFAVGVDSGEHYRFHGNKLERAGVIELDDDLGGGLAIGAEWSYRYPARERIKAIVEDPNSIIPVDSTQPESWDIKDLALYEFGKVALPYMRPYRAIEAEISASTRIAFERRILEGVLERTPVDLPEGTLKDPKGFTAEALAALQLGAQAKASLKAVHDDMKERGVAHANHPKLIAWVDWLNARYDELEQATRDAMTADGGLSRGIPVQPDPRKWDKLWPEAEQRLFKLGTASIRALETLGATRYDYAHKAAWLLKEIRRAEAQRVIDEMTLLAYDGKLKEDHFDTYLNDFVILVMCGAEMESLTKLHRNAAIAKIAATEKVIRDEGNAMEAAGAIVQASVMKYLSPSDSAKATEELARIRNATGEAEFKEASEAAMRALLATSKDGLGYLEVLHRIASDKHAKLNWLYELIHLRGSTEESDGREYDFQNDVNNRGLNLRIVTDNELEPAIALEEGATYEMSFSYYAENMDSQYAWLRFVPLDDEGDPLYAAMPPLPPEYEQGEWVPFEFARDPGGSEMQSNRVMGDTGGIWKNFKFTLRDIPPAVDGLSLEVRLNNVTSHGKFYFKDFKIARLEDFFQDDFESAEAGEVPPPMWERTLDPARGFQPWSKLSYNTVDFRKGERSLQIEPNGFNVRLTTRNSFRLESGHAYVFRGGLHTEQMEGMRAYFELMLYDLEYRPVTIDGLLTTEGNNVLRTPYRGDAERSIGWRNVKATDLWYNEQIDLDEFRGDDLRLTDEGKGGIAALDKRPRKDIAFVKVAVVVEGTEPSYHAKVLVDAVELREYPKVTLKLVQKNYDPAKSLLSGGQMDYERILQGRGILYFPEDPPAGQKYHLSIEPTVGGLARKRAGYHFEVVLKDFMGREVLAADTLGEKGLGDIVYSDDKGNISGSGVVPRITLDRLLEETRSGTQSLSTKYGYFEVHFKLRYVDEAEPLVDRRFKIGFIPESLLKEGATGELGVVLDHASTKQLRVFDTLDKLGIGRIAVPLFADGTMVDAKSYANQSYVTEFDYLLRALPRVHKTGIFADIPDVIDTLYRQDGASPVYSDTSRDEWRELITVAQTHWRDRFDSYQAGAGGDMSYVDFSGRPAQALDNIGDVSKQNGHEWAQLELPVRLLAGTEQQGALEAMTRSFHDQRWKAALAAQAKEVNDALQNGLKVDERKALEDAKQPLVLLKKNERVSFFLPANLTVEDAKTALKDYLDRMARFENVLGDDAPSSLANARTLIGGGTVPFASFAGAYSKHADHTLVIEIKRVDEDEDVDFGMQLTDLTEKVVMAKSLGFSRIFVNRLRSSSEEPDGLLSRDNYALPAFYAYRTLNGALSGKQHVPGLKLPLQGGLKHDFFRSQDGKELTFIVFPGEQDTTVKLPFGNDAFRVDLMGNKVPLPSAMKVNAMGIKSESGSIDVMIPAKRLGSGSMPIFITGIDSRLMNTTLSVKLDNPVVDAEERDNSRALQVTNTFDVPIRVNLQIPLQGASDAMDVTRDARFKDTNGKDIGDDAKAFDKFETVELQPGETKSFQFQIRPRSTMKTGMRVIPVTLRIEGRANYEVERRVEVDVRPSVFVASSSIAQRGADELVELSFKVQSNNASAEGFNMSVTLPGLDDYPRAKGFKLPPQGSADVVVPVGRFKLSQLDGQVVGVAIRQSPGRLFFNVNYVIKRDEMTGKLTLVEQK